MEVFISILKTRQLSHPPLLVLPKKQNAEAGVRHAIIGKFNNRHMLVQDLFNIGLSRSSRRPHFILFFLISFWFHLILHYCNCFMIYLRVNSHFWRICNQDTLIYNHHNHLQKHKISKKQKECFIRCRNISWMPTWEQQKSERTKWNERIINNKRWASVKHSFYRGQFLEYMSQCEDAFLTHG